jgi:hypothetical protein
MENRDFLMEEERRTVVVEDSGPQPTIGPRPIAYERVLSFSQLDAFHPEQLFLVLSPELNPMRGELAKYERKTKRWHALQPVFYNDAETGEMLYLGKQLFGIDVRIGEDLCKPAKIDRGYKLNPFWDLNPEPCVARRADGSI